MFKCFDAMFSFNVQPIPGKNEVIGELQPYIENVLRADDPKFWEKLRYENILSSEKKFVKNLSTLENIQGLTSVSEYYLKNISTYIIHKAKGPQLI